MLRIDWANPRITLEQFETFLSPYLGDNYDGLRFEDNYVYICTIDQLTGDQEDHIMNYVYSLITAPQAVTVAAQPPVSISALPTAPPFAAPTYRNKHDAVDAPVVCPDNQTTIVDFQMVLERYIYGGEIIVKGAQFGDWISAEVYDKDSIIPVPYRSVLCEAWPSVSKYIVKRFLSVGDAGETVSVSMDTRPLAADIAAGLYLRITYNAVAADGAPDRNVVANYFLTMKL